MYKNRQYKFMIVLLVLLTGILYFKFILVSNKFIYCKNKTVFSATNSENTISVEKYGYSDILECLRKNKDFAVQSIGMVENEICNVEVNYNGDIELLYTSLCYLNESKNFLSINNININKESKITSVSINFKKNK